MPTKFNEAFKYINFSMPKKERCTSSSPDVLNCNYASIATNISSRNPTLIQFFNFDLNLEEATNVSNQYVGDNTDEEDYRATIIALDTSPLFMPRDNNLQNQCNNLQWKENCHFVHGHGCILRLQK